MVGIVVNNIHDVGYQLCFLCRGVGVGSIVVMMAPYLCHSLHVDTNTVLAEGKVADLPREPKAAL